MICNVEHPPAIYLPYEGPRIRLMYSLPKVGVICRAFGALEMREICGCSLWVHDRNNTLIHLQFVADVPESKAIGEHEDAHANNQWWHK